MTYFSERIGIKNNIFRWVAETRDQQTLDQAAYLSSMYQKYKLSLCLMGTAYKSDSPLEIGSPARLLEYYLLNEFKIAPITYDPIVRSTDKLPQHATIFFISCNHKIFKETVFPQGSIVIDPWGYVESAQEDVTYIFPGR